MADYRLCVSLRVSHPTIDPDEVTEVLGTEPFRKWKVGEPRTSPKGTPLEGVTKESFWACHLHDEKRLNSKDQYLEDYLAKLNKRLYPHAKYFESLVNSGGYIEYFIGWFDGDNVGATFEPTLLKSTADLSIAIGLDIYAGDD